jgi:hypothetical protein
MILTLAGQVLQLDVAFDRLGMDSFCASVHVARSAAMALLRAVRAELRAVRPTGC